MTVLLHRRHACHVAIAAFAALSLLVAAGEASSEDTAPVRPRKVLRAELAKLRGEVARLATEVQFLQRGAETDAPAQPPSGGYGGYGLCQDPCAYDSDADGLGDCEDKCPCDPNTADTDADGWPDCVDPCPDDAANACIDPCNDDSDGDALGDCVDPCPWDPAEAVDGDGDGTFDCQDPCPEDATNACTDWCRFDQDGDGIPDCKDDCPWGSTEGSAEGSIVYPDKCWSAPMMLR
jgi:hypothetical protein